MCSDRWAISPTTKSYLIKVCFGYIASLISHPSGSGTHYMYQTGLKLHLSSSGIKAVHNPIANNFILHSLEKKWIKVRQYWKLKWQLDALKYNFWQSFNNFLTFIN